MTSYKPVHGGFIRQCVEYVDPAFGFAIGMNFWFAVRAIVLYSPCSQREEERRKFISKSKF